MHASELRALPPGTRVVVRYRLHGEQHGATDALGELVRVVVRYRLHGEQHGATDALGELVRVDAASCTVATRRGEVDIAIGDIIAAKTVPPAPAPRSRRDIHPPPGRQD